MFKETDYYDRKMNIWDCDKKIDLEKPAPPCATESQIHKHD